jgi:hypothetical protein
MAQADQVVQNDTFPTVRADINNNLAALFTNSSGGTAPTVTVAYQDWIDTSGTDPVWKKRNAANNAWITVATISGGAIAFEGTLPSQSGNAGEFLTTDGTIASWAAIASGATMQTFTSSATYTATAGKTSFLVFCTGGGGGSGNATVSNIGAGSGGGGGGGTAIRFYNATEMGGSGAVTVGSGGGATSTGGTSTFNPDGSGLTITGVGGSGSSNVSNTLGNGANGGGSTNAQIACSGSQGLRAFSSSVGAGGGVSFWAQGRGGGAVGAVRGAPGTTGGNAGTAGIVVILEW